MAFERKYGLLRCMAHSRISLFLSKKRKSLQKYQFEISLTRTANSALRMQLFFSKQKQNRCAGYWLGALTNVHRVEVLAVLEHGPPGAVALVGLGLLLLLPLLLLLQTLALGLGAPHSVVPCLPADTDFRFTVRVTVSVTAYTLARPRAYFAAGSLVS